MDSRGFLLLFMAACFYPPVSFSEPGSLLLISREEAKAIKLAISRGEPKVASPIERLRREAEVRMKAGPWSVTTHRPRGTNAGPHDFFSEGPYWWPDPSNPGGPYIRRDGEVNPNRFIENDRDLGMMAQAVLTLGAAAWLFDEPRYSERAAKVISVWFVDAATRMNPNLEYGQAIRSVSTGRGIGIIDTLPLIWAVQGMMFLEDTGRWRPQESEPVRKWFSEYIGWLIHSRKGLDEKMNGNNHSTWWAAQVASYAVFVDDKDAQRMVWDFHRSYLIPHQMRPDGSCPAEEARTKSLGYSAMNLNGFSILCRLSQNQGVDLWHFRARDGAGMEKSVAYLAPFIVKPDKWSKKQIQPYDGSHTYFLALAGLGFPSEEYLNLHRSLSKADDTWAQLVAMILAVR